MEDRITSRFDRIDEKIDLLSDITSRYDERLQQGNTKFSRMETRLDGLENRMIDIETLLAKMSGRSLIFERATWIIFSAAIAILFKYGG